MLSAAGESCCIHGPDGATAGFLFLALCFRIVLEYARWLAEQVRLDGLPHIPFGSATLRR